ncbi:MAG: hypothetical protein JOZ67_12600 [Gammaproteobacteria bacterium]|nr:hypothetical protein [Gammaproteobacteria bacterium]
MEETEPTVLTYTAFRNRELLEAWRRRQSEHEARRARARDLSDFADEDDYRPPGSLPV